MEADDNDVEKLVMELLKDVDDSRREGIGLYPVYLNPDLELSQAKLKFPKDKFSVISQLKK